MTRYEIFNKLATYPEIELHEKTLVFNLKNLE